MSKTQQSTDFRPKGSIALEILAVVLAIALIFTLTYPAKLWKAEDANVKKCRENMQHVYYAEITYLDTKLSYNDTLQKVVDFIISEPSGRLLKRFASLDSILGQKVINQFKKVTDQVTIKVDSAFGQGPDSVITLEKNIRVNALLDSMLSFANAVDLDTTEAFILDSLRHWPNYSTRIDSMALASLRGLFTCPTNSKPYIIKVNNDTLPKTVSIYCPVDSAYALRIQKDFKLGFLGGLKVENHGAIENGANSWK